VPLPQSLGAVLSATLQPCTLNRRWRLVESCCSASTRAPVPLSRSLSAVLAATLQPVTDVADGYSARWRTWLPADPLTVFTKGRRFVTCCSLLGSATLHFHSQCVERVCTSILTYLPLYKHCHASPEVFFATKCNEMRAGQYASGFTSRMGTRSHISRLNQTALFLSQGPLYLVRLIEKYFPIQLESLRARDSPEAPFSLVSRDISETVLNYSSVGQSVGLSILWSLFLFL